MVRRREFAELGKNYVIITDDANLHHPEGTTHGVFLKTSDGKLERIGHLETQAPNESEEDVIKRLEATGRAHAHQSL